MDLEERESKLYPDVNLRLAQWLARERKAILVLGEGTGGVDFDTVIENLGMSGVTEEEVLDSTVNLPQGGFVLEVDAFVEDELEMNRFQSAIRAYAQGNHHSNLFILAGERPPVGIFSAKNPWFNGPFETNIYELQKLDDSYSVTKLRPPYSTEFDVDDWQEISSKPI